MAQATKWLPAILDYTKNVKLSISTSHPKYLSPTLFLLYLFNKFKDLTTTLYAGTYIGIQANGSLEKTPRCEGNAEFLLRGCPF